MAVTTTIMGTSTVATVMITGTGALLHRLPQGLHRRTDLRRSGPAARLQGW